MFHRITLSILYLLFISLFASATPVTRWKGQCDAGPVQCCNSVQKVRLPAGLLTETTHNPCSL